MTAAAFFGISAVCMLCASAGISIVSAIIYVAK